MLAERTVVGTLRARCAEADATSAQLRLGAQLSSAPLRPRGLPASALLCVRSLRDPLPGTIRLDGMQLGPPAEWARAAEDALDEVLRGAARPALGPVPAGAEAVLFADRAELLACLARDALDGTAWTRWWWATVLRTAPPGVDPVRAAWIAEPAYVPAAFGLLARTGHAAMFARTLRAPDALELAVRVARVFAAPELARALVQADTVAAPAKPSVETQAPAPRVRRREEAASREPSPAEVWQALVPEADTPGLSIEHEIVLAVSLLLSRAPPRAREPLFARAVSRAIRLGTSRPPALELRPLPDRREASGEAGGGSPDRPRQSATPDETAPVEPRQAGGTQALARARPARRVERAPASDTESPAAERPEPAGPPLRAAAPPGKPRVASLHSRPPTPTSRRPRARRVPGTASAHSVEALRRPAKRAASLPPKPPQRPAPVPEDQALPGVGVETELGGLFFLLNVGLFLGLYGDFTTPDEPGIALDPWDFVALLGARLLGRDAGRDDAVWPLLAGLAGRRPKERPGRHFEPPADWRIPIEWLEPFDAEGVWLWSTAGGTLRIVHPTGFPVVATALRGRGAQGLLRRELRRYGVTPPLRRTSLAAESQVPLRRWTSRLAAYVAARIQVALGDPDRVHAADTVLRRHATVFMTATHVDVSMSLSTLAIEIRLAGLDRDPGWIPAAGRFVAFHFA